MKNNLNCFDEGKGETILLLHGLFGNLSNWEEVIKFLKPSYRIIVPEIPIYTIDSSKANIYGLSDYIEDFVNSKKLDNFTIVGNSLGGHLALLYTLNNPSKVRSLVLTGSSGLFENTKGVSFFKRNSYAYIKKKIEYTFYYPNTCSKEFVDDIFLMIADRSKCINAIFTARSAQKTNMSNLLHLIKTTTLLIWGLNDTITPPSVAHEFNTLLPNSSLRFIDKCCHAPMMETPQIFNNYMSEFLSSIY